MGCPNALERSKGPIKRTSKVSAKTLWEIEQIRRKTKRYSPEKGSSGVKGMGWLGEGEEVRWRVGTYTFDVGESFDILIGR